LVAVHPPVLALWRRAGAFDAVSADAVYETVDQAVEALAGRGAQFIPFG